MKSILLKARVAQVVASVLLMSVIACTPLQRSATSGAPEGSFSQAAAPQSPARETISSNLVALFVVKKDNLKNEFRGEVYPIALLLNNHYLEISNDVTEDIRNDASRDRIIQINNQRIVFNAIKNFTVISDDNQKLGEFQVEKPIVSQFVCSSIITGQGSFPGQTSLQTVFNQIPQEQSRQFTGYVANQRFDEIWRTAIAISQAPSLSQPPVVSEADLARYRQAVLTFGKAAIAKVSNGKPVPGEAVVKSIQVVDLNQDGSPELFGKVKQGSDTNASQQATPTGSASVWLTYQNGKPQLLETTHAAVGLPGAQPPADPLEAYELLETLDINGDGTDEAIVKRIGYESTSFEIYEYKNNQLNRVFSGAGYGC